MNRIKRVYKKEISNALNQARSIISDLHNHFNNTREYKFIERLVGSAQWNIVLKDVDGFFDLDFQLLLTKNSQKIKNFNYNKEKKNEATMIKEDFFNYMNKKYNDRERYKFENSTTSITFINKKAKYSIDFVLIKTFPDNNMIIRRSNSSDNPTKNSYVWNNLSNNNKAYVLFNDLSSKEKEDLIENYILPKKKIEKKKNKNDPRNLVAVDKSYHKVLHTNTYYLILNTSISLGYGLNGEEGVETVLYVYRVILGGV